VSGRGATVGELGEFALLGRLRRLLEQEGSSGAPPGSSEVVLGLGDDAAVLRPEPGFDWVVTCDAQIAGRHFLPRWMTARQIGRRAMTVNLSDLAAMGAVPRAALVSLGLDPALLVADVEELYRGLLDGLRESWISLLDAEAQSGGARRAGPLAAGRGAPATSGADPALPAIVGGNLTGTGPEWFCDLTLLGRVEAGRALRRGGARPGDRILVTGVPGRSAAGLALLRSIDEMSDRTSSAQPSSAPSSADAPSGSGAPMADPLLLHERLEERWPGAAWPRELVRAYLAPSARISLGRRLVAGGEASATIDLSDGLAGDLLHVCEASRCRAILALDRLPQSAALEAAAHALGGEGWRFSIAPSDDYELLVTVPAAVATNLARALASSGETLVTDIGEMVEGEPGVEIQGLPPGADLPRGWDHFRA
jgi:thiamine-monophosphate kinase